MRLIRHYEDVPEEARGAVVALGNFDGVHLGHQAVIAAAAKLARQYRAPLGVITFEPHPRAFFKPDQPPFRLTPFRLKMRHLQDLGVAYAFNLTFDQEMAAKSAETFVAEVLVRGLKVAQVVIGYDFCFGKNRGGNAEVLKAFGRTHGFGVTTVAAAAEGGGAVYSSTLVRERLLAGDPLGAAQALDRPWEIEGRVEHGDRRGRLLGFPTANVALGDFMHPRLGVYTVKAAVDTGAAPHWIDGVANLGRRPTVGGERVQLETHLFDFAEDLYGRHLRVALLGFIRPEMKFAGLDQLKAQIAADCLTARRQLNEYRGPTPGQTPATLMLPA